MDKDIIEVNINNNSFGASEAYKSLRTNLLYTENLKVITITSTIPNEGKTVTAFNLANSFSQMGKRVLLIDCDLRKSSLNNYLKVSKKRIGMSEVLTNQTTNFIASTNIPNLYVIMAGKKPPNPTELLSGAIFDKLIESLKELFEYIIIDTPPVSVAMDATIVGRKSDGVVLVVKNEFAKKKAIKRAKIELERNGARIVGVVLNGVKKNQLDYNGYGYDKYYY